MASAERFAVRPWLEGPAKWLDWAMGSMTQRNLYDAHYNLGKFFDALEPMKRDQNTAQDWGEVMTLDAQANWVLGNWYDAAISELMLDAAAVDSFTAPVDVALPVIGIGRWIMDHLGINPERQNLQTFVDALQGLRAEAYRASSDLGARAKAAMDEAGVVGGQAGNTATVTANAVASIPSREKFEDGTTSRTFEPFLDVAARELPGALKAPFGVAWYWWAAAAAALVLLPMLLAPTPRVTISRD